MSQLQQSDSWLGDVEKVILNLSNTRLRTLFSGHVDHVIEYSNGRFGVDESTRQHVKNIRNYVQRIGLAADRLKGMTNSIVVNVPDDKILFSLPSSSSKRPRKDDGLDQDRGGGEPMATTGAGLRSREQAGLGDNSCSKTPMELCEEGVRAISFVWELVRTHTRNEVDTTLREMFGSQGGTGGWASTAKNPLTCLLVAEPTRLTRLTRPTSLEGDLQTRLKEILGVYYRTDNATGIQTNRRLLEDDGNIQSRFELELVLLDMARLGIATTGEQLKQMSRGARKGTEYNQKYMCNVELADKYTEDHIFAKAYIHTLTTELIVYALFRRLSGSENCYEWLQAVFLALRK